MEYHMHADCYEDDYYEDDYFNDCHMCNSHGMVITCADDVCQGADFCPQGKMAICKCQVIDTVANVG